MNPNSPDDLSSLTAAIRAREEVLEWAAGAELLTLVRACTRAGWLKVLGETLTPTELGQRVDVGEMQANDVLQALFAGGVVTRIDGRYRLAPAFAALTANASGMDLEAALGLANVRSERLQMVVGGAGDSAAKSAVDGQSALAIARSSGPRPTKGAKDLFQSAYGALAPLRDRLSTRCRYLDVGCGVAGGLLCAAALYPDLQAVGIEVIPEVAAEARQRAQDAGLSDRVDIRAMDAREFVETEAFDVAFWAQPFFTAQTRGDVLAAIHRALVPSGLLAVQELHPPPRSEEARSLRSALDRVVDHSLGLVGETSAEQLVAETSAAGFVHELTETTPLGRIVLMRRL